MKNFPTELSELIFSFYLPSNVSDKYTSPTILCLVCRQWQTVVVNRPKFWAILKLSPKKLRAISSETTPGASQEMLLRWLKRSNDMPMSLVMRVVEKSDEDGVLIVLDNESIRKRLEALDIKVKNWEDGGSFAKIEPAFPRLRTLHFTATTRQHGPRIPAHASTLSKFIKDIVLSNSELRELTWGLPFQNLLPDNVQAPYMSLNWGAGLTIVNLSTLQSTSECFAIFKSSPLLRKCHFDCKRSPSRSPGPVSNSFRTIAASLRTLSLGGCVHPSFFTVLTAPTLERLSISKSGIMPRSTDKRLPETLPEFLERSRCPLKELNLEGGCFDARSFSRCFKAVPTLEIVFVCDPSLTTHSSNDLLKALTPLASTDQSFVILCPNLRQLYLQSLDVPAEGLLSRLVSSRMGSQAIRNGVSELEDIGFEFKSALPKSDRAYLKSIGIHT